MGTSNNCDFSAAEDGGKIITIEFIKSYKLLRFVNFNFLRFPYIRVQSTAEVNFRV